MRRGEDVLDARHGNRLAQRHLSRPRRKRERRGELRLQVRLHRARRVRRRRPGQPNANGWYRAPSTSASPRRDALSGPPSCEAAKSYGGPGQRGGSRQRHLHGQGGKQRRGIAHAQVRRHGSGRDRNGVAAAERERLVPSPARRQLRRDRRALGALEPAKQPRATADPTTGRQSSAAPARTRRETTARHRSRSSTTPRLRSRPRRPSRQPNANGWYRAPLDVSFAATDALSGPPTLRSSQELRRTRQRGGSRQRHLHGQGGKQRRGIAHAQIRRHGSGRVRNGRRGSRTPTAGTGPRSTSASPRPTRSRGPRAAKQPRATADRTTGRQSSAAPARTRRETTARHRSRSNTTPRLRSRPQRRRGQPNANGWYRAPLDVSFAATDALSGPPTCEAAKSYGGPGQRGGSRQRHLHGQGGKQRRGIADAQIRRHGSGRDRDGVAASRTRTAGTERPLDVSFAAHRRAIGHSSPATLEELRRPGHGRGRCQRRLHGTRPATTATRVVQLKYDATAPVRRPRRRRASRTRTAGTTRRSDGQLHRRRTRSPGSEPATRPRRYCGPDNGRRRRQRHLPRPAGNSARRLAHASNTTRPRRSTTATPSRPAERQRLVQRLGRPSASRRPTRSPGSRPARPRRPTPGRTPSPPWSAAPAWTRPGTAALASFALKYDATAPQATATPSQAAERERLVQRARSRSASAAPTRPPASFPAIRAKHVLRARQRDRRRSAVMCLDRAGNPSAAATFGFKYDATAPTVGTPVPTRPEDRAGWYNRPVAFAVQGTDEMSGISSCPPQSYAGPG